MAGLLTRRAYTVAIFRQPYRFKSWCCKEKENKEATVKNASQESLYKNYDLNRCQKTVFCPKTRMDCGKPKQEPPPCGKPKMGITDVLGKMIWFCIKSGIVVAVVYASIDAGVWKSPDETYELAKAMYKRILEIFGYGGDGGGSGAGDEPRMLTAAEVKYNTVQVWNKGVRIIFNRFAHPYVD